MRRLITMLAGALVLLAIGFSSSVAKADNAPDEVYVYGEVNGIVNWNEGTLSKMAKMDPLGNNAWELKLTNTNPTKFKLCGIFSGSNVYYATDSDTADKELTGTVSNLSSWRRTDGIDKGRFWFGNLNGKYLYVTWDVNAGANGFKISIKDQSSKGNTPSVDGPETIYLFGDYGSGNIWSNQTNGAKLKKTSVKDGKAVYTGTVDFQKAEKEDACFFRFYDGSKESGPSDTNNDETVSLDTPFSTTNNTGKAFKFTPTTKGTHTVTLIYNGVQNYSVTITEGTPVVTYDYTVYFMKPSSWSKAYVTFHYDTANAASAVNGNIAMAAAADSYEMTQVEGNKYMYKLTGATRQPAKVSFSDGTDANKTEEFAFEDNKTYGEPEVTYPEAIYIFGNVGDYTSWSTKNTEYKLEKAAGGNTYTGTVKFRNGDNWFRFFDGTNESGPDAEENGSDESITIGTEFNTTQKAKKAFSINCSQEGWYNVKLIYNGDRNYSVIITDPNAYEDPYNGQIYLMSDGQYTIPVATLEYQNGGKYSATIDADAFGNGINKFFVVEKLIDNASSIADYAGTMFTTTGNDDATIAGDGGNTDISKNNSGFINWTMPADAIAATFTVNLVNNDFKISVTKDNSTYYLTGDINGWATDQTEEGKATLAEYKFRPVRASEAAAKLNGETGWYVLPLERMHGQYQISTGNWSTTRWSTNWSCTQTVNGKTYEFKDGAEMYTKDNPDNNQDIKDENEARDLAVNDYCTKAMTPDDGMPAEANLKSITGDGSLYNMHLQHNYYNNASIYFNPTKNMAFINGEAEDIYIYYYNAEVESGCDGSQKIWVEAKVENKNTNNYYYNRTQIGQGRYMPWEEITGDELNQPAIARKVLPQNDGKKWAYRITIPAGLEAPYMADGTEHRFVFYIKNTSKIRDDIRHAIVGHSFYFIYNENLPTVVLNYRIPNDSGDFVEATTSSSDIHSINFRLLAYDYLGNVQYVQEYPEGQTSGLRPRTDKRSEARTWTYNGTVNTADHTDFKELVSSFGETTTWNICTTTTQAPSATVSYATNDETPAWHKNYNLDRVMPGDVNRFLEIEVVRKDPEPEPGTEPKLIHEFYSDFVTGNDGLIGAEETTNNITNDIDTQALITNKLKPGHDRKPEYKLDGTHLYVQVNAAIPTGVDNIISDDDSYAAPVYYNLQGVRVTNPDKGIYIMVKGNTSKKVRF